MPGLELLRATMRLSGGVAHEQRSLADQTGARLAALPERGR